MSNEELAERIKNGEIDLAFDLWQQVQRLIRKIMFNYLPKDGSTNRVELDDLIQAGFIGMMKAVNDFDPSSDFAFTTFLNRHLTNMAREVLGLRSEKRDPLIKAVSMNAPVSANAEDLTLADTLQDNSTLFVYDDLIDGLDQKADIRSILEQIERLDPMEQKVFKERYLYGLTLKDIGENHGYKIEKVRYMVDKSLKEIRKSSAVRKMVKEQYLDRSKSFYFQKSIRGFNTTFSSAVEDIVFQRETLREKLSAELADLTMRTCQNLSSCLGSETFVQCPLHLICNVQRMHP